MPDIRAKVSVQSERIISLIEECFGTQAEMARQTGLTQTKINNYVCMRVCPYRERDGEWRSDAVDLATALGVEPIDLWPEHMRHIRLARCQGQVTLSLDAVRALTSGDDRVEIRDLISAISGPLTDREARVVFQRANGATLDEVGRDVGVSRERLRQIEAKAHRKMRSRATDLGIDPADVL